MFVGSQPVRVVGADAVFAQEVGIPALDEIHPALHRIPVFLNNGLVAILHPRRPRNDHSRITPAGCSHHAFVPRRRPFCFPSDWKGVGRDIGERALAGLSVDNVLDEFLREGSDVEVVASGSPEDSRVSHPTQPFVALRTIGRDAQEIASLAPDANRPHLIDQVA